MASQTAQQGEKDRNKGCQGPQGYSGLVGALDRVARDVLGVLAEPGPWDAARDLRGRARGVDDEVFSGRGAFACHCSADGQTPHTRHSVETHGNNDTHKERRDTNTITRPPARTTQ